MDWILAVRATVLTTTGVPILVLLFKILKLLRNREVASSRIFLRGDRFQKVTIAFALSSFAGLFGAVILFFWSFSGADVLVALAACQFIALILLMYYAVYVFYTILRG